MTAILVGNLVKRYHNGVQALNGLSLTVRAGEIFSLLGPNGAGKSTLIRILTTLLRPTAGTVKLLGRDVVGGAQAIRPEIACVAQRTSIDACLSLAENMLFQSQIYQIPRAEAQKRMEALIGCFGLEQYMSHPVASCSGGVKRRLDIALNMMSNPKILFLDEPTVGMDVQSRRAMWDMLERIRGEFGATIFLTTHYLEEADCLSDTICIMRDGKEAAQGTPDALRKYLRRDLLKLSFPGRETAQQCARQLAELFAGRAMELRGEAVVLPAEDGQEDLTRAGRFLLQRQVPFTGLEITRPTIEDVFLRLTGDKEGCV